MRRGDASLLYQRRHGGGLRRPARCRHQWLKWAASFATNDIWRHVGVHTRVEGREKSFVVKHEIGRNGELLAERETGFSPFVTRTSAHQGRTTAGGFRRQCSRSLPALAFTSQDLARNRSGNADFHAHLTGQLVKSFAVRSTDASVAAGRGPRSVGLGQTPSSVRRLARDGQIPRPS